MVKLVAYELKKTVLHIWVLVLFLASVAAENYPVWEVYSFTPEGYRYGQSFYKENGGVLDAEKYDRIQKLLYVKREDGWVSQEFMYSDTALDTINRYLVHQKESYQEIRAVAERNIQRYTALQDDYQVRKNQRILEMFSGNRELQLVDINTWTDFFSYQYWLSIPILLLTLLVATIFSSEFEAGCVPVLTATATGRRKLYWIKILIAASIGFVWMFLLGLISTVLYRIWFPIVNWDASVQSIPLFSKYPGSATLGQMVWICGALQCAAGTVHAVVVAVISSFFKKNISALSVSGGWYLIGYYGYALVRYNGNSFGLSFEHVMVQKIVNGLRYFLYTMWFEPVNYVRKPVFVNVCGYPMLLTGISGILIGVLTVLFTFCGYKWYTKDCR